MATTPLITLNNGISIPQLGLGVYRSTVDQTVRVVSSAIAKGYRLIDTAAAYGNEEQVGEGIRQSGIDRSELFITTKLFLADYGYDAALKAFDVSIQKLGLDYLDLYLLHWPVPRQFDETLASWRALEKLHKEGRIKSIGVCNFNPDHLNNLIEQSDVIPVVNQVELHPYFSQENVRAANAKHNILTQAWSPIGGVKRYWATDPEAVHDPLRDPVITSIAAKYGKSAAQVILRWHIETGNIVIPKSVTPARIKENFDIFDFHLNGTDHDAITKLDKADGRIGPNPSTFSAG